MSETPNDELPESTWTGAFTIYGVELKCHVLSTGERIIEADGLLKLFAAMSEGGWGKTLDHEEIKKFTQWQQGISP